jgi:hypothetical protein
VRTGGVDDALHRQIIRAVCGNRAVMANASSANGEVFRFAQDDTLKVAEHLSCVGSVALCYGSLTPLRKFLLE